MQWLVPFVAALAGTSWVLDATASATPAAELGATIAAKGTRSGVPACASCHGAKGEGNTAGGFPRLAGLGKAYLDRQLSAFARGERASPVVARRAPSKDAKR